MIWPFKKETPPTKDRRVWNDDWQVGDIAECIVEPDVWHGDCPPWLRPKKGDRFVVEGFEESRSTYTQDRYYFLKFRGNNQAIYPCQAFRKVGPISKEESETTKALKDRILGNPNAPEGPVREVEHG